ncbi:hypothetical protein [Aquimarina algiphila]|uniref:hypothetical protein n=1 Tax=Aquimarina algiphila TaxID=2047982 RepID=UPI00232D6574|nr:hypothetical protein [Aquimarina algiphila]
MQEEIIKIFEINTDAIGTNRGFYYQYLLVLKKWTSNYINEKESFTYTEVEDDIKEIGDKLVFTQVKCYNSSFSLNSSEIKKSLFNFFILYLKYQNEKTSFCFATNSNISKNEKLLLSWDKDRNLENKELLKNASRKIKEILVKEVNNRKNKKLQKNYSIIQKDKIKNTSNDFKNFIKKLDIEPFVRSINWEFNSISPEKAIDLIIKEIHEILVHLKFGGKPKSLLFSVFLSEIYRCSQNKETSERMLNNQTILSLLKQTNKELTKLVDDKITKLLRIEIESLKLSIDEIRHVQNTHTTEIEELKKEVKNPLEKKPKYLNLLPDFSSRDIYGWNDFLNEVNSILKNKKTLCIHSEGGMGKTSLAYKYLKLFNDYDHILWVNVEYSIPNAFVLDSILLKNLKIDIKNNDKKLELQSILNELNKLEGRNLLIIDIQECEDEIAQIKSLLLSQNWHKLILSRSLLKIVPNIKLPRINFNDAKSVYLSFCKKEKIKDSLFKKLFELIDYNVLVIELIAKTIHNSIDLSLDNLINSFQEQKLDQNDFNIDIEITDRIESIRIFNYLIDKFSLPKLENFEKHYLEFLALLPSNDIIVEDLISINGKKHYSENKVAITNIINSLEKKGLLNLSEDRARVHIHKIISEIIIYVQRKELSPFASCMFYISWLTSRLKEGYYSPKNSFRYLKYAESILNSLKEKYRESLYQPLLLLENELLFSKNFYLGANDHLDQLIDLSKRAEAYPLLDKTNLGVIYNNLGLGYAENNEKELAIKYFNKALNVYPKGSEEKFLQLRITSLNNLSNVYLDKNDLVNVIKNFNKVQKIRKKYSLYDDQQLSAEYRILSKSYAITGSFKQAIDLLESGIELHKSLNSLKRNDFYLAVYYNELSNLYLALEDIKKAIENQESGIKILENMGLNNSKYLFSMYQVSLNLYQYLGLKKKEENMKNKIELFKIHQS